MEELVPLTISSSIRNNPTVLFTKSREYYLLYDPIDEENHVRCELFGFIYGHFKIETLKKGFFSYRGKKYLCSQVVAGSIIVDEWHSFQWKKKRQFNRFIRPRALFDMFLADLFFPVLKSSEKLIIPGVKDRFVIHPFPGTNGDGIHFEPRDINNSGLSDPAIRSFFRYMKNDLLIYLEDFIQLHHDKFRSDLKYRVSLYPAIRNKYWEELKLCFEPSFQKYVSASVENYILQL